MQQGSKTVVEHGTSAKADVSEAAVSTKDRVTKKDRGFHRRRGAIFSIFGKNTDHSHDDTAVLLCQPPSVSSILIYS